MMFKTKRKSKEPTVADELRAATKAAKDAIDHQISTLLEDLIKATVEKARARAAKGGNTVLLEGQEFNLFMNVATGHKGRDAASLMLQHALGDLGLKSKDDVGNRNGPGGYTVSW